MRSTQSLPQFTERNCWSVLIGVSRYRWSVHVATFSVAVALGALASFVVTYGVVSLVRAVAGDGPTAIVSAAAIVYVATRDLGARTPVPYRASQVPDWIRRVMPPSLTAFIYGAQLGTGFLTRFTNSTHFAFAFGLPFLVHGWEVLATIAALAVGKTIVIVISAVNSDSEDFDETVNRRFPWRPNGMRLLRLSNATAALAVAVTLGTMSS